MPAEAPPPGSGVLKGRSILVLDDERSIRMLLDEGLSAQGLLVDCAATPAEAMESAGRRSYHTLLCDLNLSHGGSATMDGREAARQILSAAGTSRSCARFSPPSPPRKYKAERFVLANSRLLR
jgi:CheY-like chemotaxis protein